MTYIKHRSAAFRIHTTARRLQLMADGGVEKDFFLAMCARLPLKSGAPMVLSLRLPSYRKDIVERPRARSRPSIRCDDDVSAWAPIDFAWPLSWCFCGRILCLSLEQTRAMSKSAHFPLHHAILKYKYMFQLGRHRRRVILYYFHAGHSENELCTPACWGLAWPRKRKDIYRKTYIL